MVDSVYQDIEGQDCGFTKHDDNKWTEMLSENFVRTQKKERSQVKRHLRWVTDGSIYLLLVIDLPVFDYQLSVIHVRLEETKNSHRFCHGLTKFFFSSDFHFFFDFWSVDELTECVRGLIQLGTHRPLLRTVTRKFKDLLL